MTPNILKWIVDLPINYKEKTLEIGSLDVNGNVRDLFNDYIGIDMRKGENVDMVLRGNKLTTKFKQNTFGNVLYMETMEHDDRFWETLMNIRVVTKKGGHLILTVPGINFHKHEHPSDYFRFTKESIENLTSFINFDIILIQETENHCKEKHIFCLAKKL